MKKVGKDMLVEGAAKSQSRSKGIALVVFAAMLWGVSGTVAQYLFQRKFTPEWLVVIRLLLSGIILLFYAFIKLKKDIWGIWKYKHHRFNLILFSIIGMLGVQYTYFAAIKHSNAATATILQYLSMVVITCYLAVFLRKIPSLRQAVAIVLAIVGTFFIITHGNVHALSISKQGLFWGLSSAFALAFYTLQPCSLLRKWDSIVIVGWGMLVGGMVFGIFCHSWNFTGQWSGVSISGVIFVVIFGTLIPFWCYMESINYIKPSETNVLACIEPLSSVLLSVFWLHISFGITEWIGAICIITTVIILSGQKT